MVEALQRKVKVQYSTVIDWEHDQRSTTINNEAVLPTLMLKKLELLTSSPY